MLNKKQHYENYCKLTDLYGRPAVADDEAAALYILSASRRLMERAENSVGRENINFENMTSGTGGAERVMMTLAHNLYNGDVAVYVDELCDYLDGETFDCCIHAMRVLKFGAPYLRKLFENCEVTINDGK